MLRAAIRRKLLRWYDRHRRDLPWRRRPGDAYAQWVAEVMLQQTRVETVLDYFDRFLRRFPTINILANARSETVLKHWEGLGYYRRVLNLHRAARIIRNAGYGLPTTAVDFECLPGVGKYTAAAIASIALGERIAAVDGNVARVIARLFAIEEDVLTSAGRRRVEAVADQLVPVNRPGDFNQAWMDLGSLVCKPRSPDCPHCPLRTHCAALELGLTDSIPNRDVRRRLRPMPMNLVAAVLRCRGRMLVQQASPGGLWAGLWAFPSAECPADGTVTGAFRRLVRGCGVKLIGKPLQAGVLEHRLTHRAITFRVIVATVAESRLAATDSGVRWVTPAAFAKLSVSTAHRRVFKKAASVMDTQHRGARAEGLSRGSRTLAQL